MFRTALEIYLIKYGWNKRANHFPFDGPRVSAHTKVHICFYHGTELIYDIVDGVDKSPFHFLFSVSLCTTHYCTQ